MKIINKNNYVEKAEKTIINLKNKKDKKGRDVTMVTMSKLRNLLAMSVDIYNDMLRYEDDILNSEIKARIDYLRVRFIYDAGREPKVKDLIEEAKLIDILKEIETKSDYILFYHYMESLVAFHKFNGGRD